MKFLSYPKLDTVRAKIKKIPWVLADRAFLIIIFLIFLVLLLGVFLFSYNEYMVSAKKEGKITVEQSFKFKNKLYQEVLATWQEKEKNLEESWQEEYQNPF